METKKAEKQRRTVTDLDGLYDATETAKWMGLSPRTLIRLAKEGRVPAVRLNGRVYRFNPRTILSKAA